MRLAGQCGTHRPATVSERPAAAPPRAQQGRRVKCETCKGTAWINRGLAVSDYTSLVLSLPVLILQLVYLTGLVQDLSLQFVGGQGMFQQLEFESGRLVQHLRATQQTPAGQLSRGPGAPWQGPSPRARIHPGLTGSEARFPGVAGVCLLASACQSRQRCVCQITRREFPCPAGLAVLSERWV